MSLFSIAKTGGPVTTLLTPNELPVIADGPLQVDEGYLYFIGGTSHHWEQQGILRMPVAGGPFQYLTQNRDPVSFAIDATAIYYTEGERYPGMILKIDGSDHPLGPPGTIPGSNGIWIDNDHIYLEAIDVNNHGTWQSMSKSGPPLTPLPLTPLPLSPSVNEYLAHLDQDADYFYWEAAFFYNGFLRADDGDWTMRKSLGKRVQLAPPPVFITQTLSNSTHMFLYDFRDSQLWKVEKSCIDTLPDGGHVTWPALDGGTGK